MVEGKLGPIHRVMVVVRLADGRLVIWNGIALDEPEMKELEAWGTPAFLVVPNAGHRMDARIWKKRYPALTVIAPPGARKKVEQIVAVDRTDGDFGDPSVTLTFPACAAGREALMTVKHADGRTTIVINDLVMNSRHGTRLLRLHVQADGLHVERRRRCHCRRASLLVKDKPGLKTLLAAARRHARSSSRVIVSHGDNLETGAAEGLRRRRRPSDGTSRGIVPSLC